MRVPVIIRDLGARRLAVSAPAADRAAGTCRGGDADAPADGQPRDGLNFGAFGKSLDRAPAKCLVRLGRQTGLENNAVCLITER